MKIEIEYFGGERLHVDLTRVVKYNPDPTDLTKFRELIGDVGCDSSYVARMIQCGAPLALVDRNGNGTIAEMVSMHNVRRVYNLNGRNGQDPHC